MTFSFLFLISWPFGLKSYFCNMSLRRYLQLSSSPASSCLHPHAAITSFLTFNCLTSLSIWGVKWSYLNCIWTFCAHSVLMYVLVLQDTRSTNRPDISSCYSLSIKSSWWNIQTLLYFLICPCSKTSTSPSLCPSSHLFMPNCSCIHSSTIHATIIYDTLSLPFGLLPI